VNRYENHLINTGAQAKWMIEKVGADNIFIHLDTYHMNIEEKGAGNGILDAREHLRYIHLSESDRGTPGEGTCDWDEVYADARRHRLQGRPGHGELHQHAARGGLRPRRLAPGGREL
jgi:sugar phosphate isomerase/epimerase